MSNRSLYFKAGWNLFVAGAQTFPNTPYTWVDVRDVANAHIQAYELLEASGRFCLVETVSDSSETLKISCTSSTLRYIYLKSKFLLGITSTIISGINMILLLIIPLDDCWHKFYPASSYSTITQHVQRLLLLVLGLLLLSFEMNPHVLLTHGRPADDTPYVPAFQVSQEKAKGLGIHFTPLEVSLKDTIESLKENNLISFWFNFLAAMQTNHLLINSVPGIPYIIVRK